MSDCNKFKAKFSQDCTNKTYALLRGILSTLSGKYFGFTLCLIPTSFIGNGRPGLTVYSLADDLCLGKCRNCMVQTTLPNGPRIKAVTVGWGSKVQVRNQCLFIQRIIHKNILQDPLIIIYKI